MRDRFSGQRETVATDRRVKDVCQETREYSHRHEQHAEGTDEEEELHEDQTIRDHLICSQEGRGEVLLPQG